MAIRDRWNRITRKSGSSSSSSSGGRSDDSQTDITSTTACSSTTAVCTTPTPRGPAPTRSPFRLVRVTSWRSSGTHTPSSQHTTNTVDFSSLPSRSKKSTAPKKKGGAAKPRRSMLRQTWKHPSERPLTEDNLRHQEMLGMFTMKFGRTRRGSSGAESSHSDVSPGNSRPVSLDIGRDSVAWGQWDDGFGQKRMSSFAVGPWDQGTVAEENS